MIMDSINWQTGKPPADVLLLILCDDFMGEYIAKAKRKDYKKPIGRKTWRWVDENDNPLTRKQQPECWALLTEE